jgi:hypothetical protein
VQISRETQAVTQRGFGTLLILGDNGNFGGGSLIRTYTSLAGVADDFETTDEEYKAATAYFSASPRPRELKIGIWDSGAETPDIVADLELVRDQDADWYGLVITSRSKSDQLAIAAWAEANTVIFGTSSDEAEIVDTAYSSDTGGGASLAKQFEEASYARTWLMYHPDADGSADDPWADAAWFGKMLPTQPGAATWKFKTLAGVPVYTLTATQLTNVNAKKCNYYIDVAGVDITQEGWCASGEYIDVIHGVDWLQARIEERVFGLLVRSPKIPYTDAGVATITAEIRAALDLAVARNVLAADPAPVVSAPRVLDVPTNDRALRFLPDVKFGGRLAGAIHSLDIRGVVTV